MSQGLKPKKLFKVAKEFNVTSNSIVEVLKDKGFEIENRMNTSVTPEMQKALDEVYAEDKTNRETHQKTREEYQERRTTLKSRQNETISIDHVPDPMDDLLPLDLEDTPLEPETDTDVVDTPEEIPVPPVSSIPTVESVEIDNTLDKSSQVDATHENVKAEEDDKPKASTESEEDITEKEIVTGKIDKKDGLTIDNDSSSQVDETKEESDEDSDLSDFDTADVPNEDDLEVIKAHTEKLRGTRLLGKIEIEKDIPKKSKSQKSKKKVQTAESESEEDVAKQKKRKKRIKRSKTGDEVENTTSPTKVKRSKVDEVDVEQKMKETLQMQRSSNKKRAKIRRKKRDEMGAKREEEEILRELESDILEVTEFITTSELAELLEVSVTDIITACMSIGLMISMNQRLEASTIEMIAGEFNRGVTFVDAEELLDDPIEEEDDPKNLTSRSPVVTIMGHVDHGKTSLLDYIRKSKVASGEAGGITQHIGAYSVVTNEGKAITFLDTPGHEAFTAMRARGAQVTDIVILVIAADDSVMPQTIEAINHAQAAGVPIIVAINKIDKPEANAQKIRQQLTEHNVIVEDYGGNVQVSEVSAQTGQNIDELLDKVLIEAELLELKANPNRLATGIVLESRIDKGKGVVANVLVQNGALKIGDAFIAGQYFGRVRSMENEFGKRIDVVGPSTPTQLTGFDGLPQAGDRLISMVDERKVKDIAQQRQQLKREQSLRLVKHITLDDLSRRMALGEVSDLNIIIKGDVDGSIEALAGTLQKLSNDEVVVKIIHTGVGAITESDILLASASDAIIIGFQVRPTANARKLGEKEQIDIRLFSVIYDAIDEVRDALEGLLSPDLKEKITSNVEVRDIFKVPNVGTVAGCYVTEGKINRNSKIRLVRDGIVTYNGEILALKRFKEDVKEVATGYECGISIRNFNDIKVGDIIESYEIIETKRHLK